MYKVIKRFVDMQDGGHEYNVGDKFPREGVEVSKYRIDRLSGDKNRQRTPLIAKEKGLNLATTPAQSSPNEPEQGAVPELVKRDGKQKSGGRKKKED